MEKSEAITLLYLMNQDLSHLSSVSDYIDQFNETEKQVKSVIQTKSQSQWGIGNIKL